ncbi:MAG TPA: hypothetical protein VJA22_01025, partial [Patescibacteria group bacterium]|nr:hypothetical protein [Patescibacteria group bacterium]
MIVKELIFRNAQRNSIMIFLIAGFVSMSVFLHPFVSIAIASLLLAGLFFAQHMDFALYVLILMTPFVDFQIVWGELNVPIADAFAMLMFISWALRALLFRGESITNTIRSNTPVAIPFLLFLIACTLSFFNTPDMAASIKYFLRPMLFFYLMFMIIPYVSIENTKILKRALVVSFTLGIVISLMGLISLFLPEQSGEIFRRALPISIFGMYPLGTNHNLIAEVLVAVIPLGWFLSTHERNKHRKQALKLASVFVASICVLTFSRAGWIVLFS